MKDSLKREVLISQFLMIVQAQPLKEKLRYLIASNYQKA